MTRTAAQGTFSRMERGLYEQIADDELVSALEAFVGPYRAQRLNEGGSHAVLTEHIAHLLIQVLRRQPAQDRLHHQVALGNRLVHLLSDDDGTVEPDAQMLPADVRRLLSAPGEESAPPRPGRAELGRAFCPLCVGAAETWSKTQHVILGVRAVAARGSRLGSTRR